MLFSLFSGWLHASVTQAHGQTFIFIYQGWNFLPQPPSVPPVQRSHIILILQAAALLTVPHMCQEFVSPRSIQTVTHPFDMWPDVTPSFHPSPSADKDVIPWSISLFSFSFIPTGKTVQKQRLFSRKFPQTPSMAHANSPAPDSHYWLMLRWDAKSKQTDKSTNK